MKSFLPYLLKIVLGLLLVTPATAVVAQIAQKPAVVVSVTNIDKLLSDVGYVTRTAGSPEVGALITLMSGQYIEGLDSKRPSGVYITFTPQPTGVLFLPVSNFDAVVAKVEEFLGEVEELPNGVRKLSAQRAIYFKEQNGWLFASDTLGNLGQLPDDPQQLLEGMNDQYDIAVRANVQSVPMELRQMALSEIKEGFERQLANEADLEKRRAQREIGSNAVDKIASFIKEADQVTVGWGTDREASQTFVDFSVTALPNTELAAQVNSTAKLTSDFSGFLAPDAATTFHFTAAVTKSDINQIVKGLVMVREKTLQQIDKDNELPSAEARAQAKEIVGSLMDVLQQTVESGKLNGGATLMLAPQKINFVAGGYLADGKSVEANLKRMVELARKTKDNPDVEIKFDVAQHGEVALHTLTAPIPEQEADARKVLGDKIVMVIGTGPKSFYIGFGDDSMQLLKQIIDTSVGAANGNALPMNLHFALQPILAFAASVDDDPMVAALANSLANGQGKDHVAITATPIEQGMSYRLSVEEGVLQLIGQAAKFRNNQNRDPF